MNAISLLIGLLLGAALGAVIGYLLSRGRLAGLAADLTGQARAAEERARAADQRAALMEAAAEKREALIDGQLAERFQELSAQALDRSAQTFLTMAEGRLSAANVKAAGDLDTRKAAVEQLVQPLRDTLARVESQLRETEAARRSSHAALAEQVAIARQSSDQLRTQTQALVTALRRPEARGRWGEMQLRRVVELAGMSQQVRLRRAGRRLDVRRRAAARHGDQAGGRQEHRGRLEGVTGRVPGSGRDLGRGSSARPGCGRTPGTSASTSTGWPPRRTGPR